MKLYLLRHGKADWPDWSQPDDERPLTKDGKEEMHRMAAFLPRLKVKPELILSSPLPRAWQTAEIVAESLGAELREEPSLGRSFGPLQLHKMIQHVDRDELMIVGHEPDFSA